jgi:predicted nucleic acid-binding protein
MQVVDASVAAKWFFVESGDQEARELALSGGALIAPDLIVPEVCNVAWRKVVEKEITVERALGIALQLPSLLNRLIPAAELAPRAVELATKLRHPIYDCFYLALAEIADGELVTADRKFLKVIGRAGFDRKRIRLIGGEH